MNHIYILLPDEEAPLSFFAHKDTDTIEVIKINHDQSIVDYCQGFVKDGAFVFFSDSTGLNLSKKVSEAIEIGNGRLNANGSRIYLSPYIGLTPPPVHQSPINRTCMNREPIFEDDLVDGNFI